MATITNKTNKSLSVSLPGGKKLRLGPLKSAEMSAKAVDHPAVLKLIESGEVEVEVEGSRQKSKQSGDGGKGGARTSSGGVGHGSGIRRTGDR